MFIQQGTHELIELRKIGHNTKEQNSHMTRRDVLAATNQALSNTITGEGLYVLRSTHHVFDCPVSQVEAT